ncbi:MAG: S1 family peptidase [Gemmatimonadota bacterium]|nr:S1 family peptidase [Gemmatimonadota bacterium]
MRLRSFVSPLAVALLLSACADGPDPLLTGPVAGVPAPSFIVNGVPDGAGHPNVGAILYDFSANGAIEAEETFCSGSLIAPTVFLTAAHCLYGWPAGSQLYVTFDADLRDGASPLIPAVSAIYDPRFGHDRAHLYDLGVVILPTGSTAGITPAALPPAGYLDQRAARGGLRDQLFENVGYGLEAFFRPAPPRYRDPRQRLVSESPFMALQPTWLGLLMNANATGKGGDCYGDSGSPKFVAGTNMIVATVTTGDRICRATTWDWRLDTEAARSFLRGYVTLP